MLTRSSPPLSPSLALRIAAQPARNREPYTIERFPCLQGGILLVGYDGRGEVMVELRLSASKFSERTIDKMRRWMKANDEPVPLALGLSK